MTTSKKAENVRDVIRYLQKFKNALLVIYLDDKTISSPLFSSHIRDIALLHQAGLLVVLIPGARRRIDEVLKKELLERIDTIVRNDEDIESALDLVDQRLLVEVLGIDKNICISCRQIWKKMQKRRLGRG